MVMVMSTAAMPLCGGEIGRRGNGQGRTGSHSITIYFWEERSKVFLVRILRQRSTKGSWENMQKFEITVSKTVIVFLDIKQIAHDKYICEASLRDQSFQESMTSWLIYQQGQFKHDQTSDCPCISKLSKLLLCHAQLEFCDLVMFVFPCDFPNE